MSSGLKYPIILAMSRKNERLGLNLGEREFLYRTDLKTWNRFFITSCCSPDIAIPAGWEFGRFRETAQVFSIPEEFKSVKTIADIVDVIYLHPGQQFREIFLRGLSRFILV